MIYCIDSHTFCWCIKKQAAEHDQYRLKQADALLKWIDAGKHHLMIPTIVLAECLIKESEENHIEIIKKAYEFAMIVDFDTRASLKYGNLLRLDKWDSAKDLSRLNNIRREKMKLDHTIVACALANGADAIFSEDDDIIKFSNGIIPVKSISEIPIQSTLFDNSGNPNIYL